MGSDSANICAQCHDLGRGCCTLGAFGSDEMFPMTWSEVQTIVRETGLFPERFVVADRPPADFLRMAGALHPLFSGCMPGGIRLRLKVAGDKCVFLSEHGCQLSKDLRPFYCQLYPFFFTPDGRLMVLMSERCLAQEGARSWREVMTRMEEGEDRLRVLLARYQEAASRHHHQPGPLVVAAARAGR